MSTTRTADQTEAAIFWQDHPLGTWNRVLQSVAATYRLDVAASARLFAAVNLAAADAVIGCWHSKYLWNFWRPVTAIREASNDGNPATAGDPAWLPLFDPSTPQFGSPLTTPAFPDHPSGHGCASGAVLETPRALLRQRPGPAHDHQRPHAHDAPLPSPVGRAGGDRRRPRVGRRALPHGRRGRCGGRPRAARWVDRHAFQRMR